MGLFLSREEMWDLPIDPIDKRQRHVTHWMGNIGWALANSVFKVAFRMRVDGRENLSVFKGLSGVVVVCNHTSYLDVACMYLSARPSQWIRIMGRDSLFETAHGLGGQILSRVGAFPIKRDTSDRTALKRAARDLRNKEIVGILPEGTRRGKGSLKPKLHAGAALIARMGGNVPIVPMTVRNVEMIKRKGERLRFPKVTIEFGEPILLKDFDGMPKDQRLEGCTWYAMRQCFSMFYGIPADEVDMAELFPENHDYTEYFDEHPVPAHSALEVAAAIADKEMDRLDRLEAKALEEAASEAGMTDRQGPERQG